MEASTFEQVARMVAELGALGLAVGLLNIFCVRLVRLEEVPGAKRARVRWWTLHNPAFLTGSAVVLAAGLAMLVAA
jgi:hypothetical protein